MSHVIQRCGHSENKNTDLRLSPFACFENETFFPNVIRHSPSAMNNTAELSSSPHRGRNSSGSPIPSFAVSSSQHEGPPISSNPECTSENKQDFYNEPNDDDSLDSDPDKYHDHLDMDRSSLSPTHYDQISNSSRDSSPKSEITTLWNEGGPLLPEAPEIILCFWCKRVCDSRPTGDGTKENFAFANGDRNFCSEICFNQCRRASFKKSKVCDWCRHVRPTVSYVDFNDGNHQLQICSDKCLNQYKMHIFCRETEAHLQLHPHLNDLKSNKNDSLITPELWLRDCSDLKSSSTESNNDLELKTSIFEERKEAHKHSSLNSDLVGNPHSNKPSKPTSSYSQFSSSSSSCSPKSYDASEPMNLTTQHLHNRDSLHDETLRKSPNGRLKAGAAKPLSSSSDSKKNYFSRWGRSRTRHPRGEGRESMLSLTSGKANEQKSSTAALSDIPHESIDSKVVGTIRVRQLEDMPLQQDAEIFESSPSPTNAHLSEITNLGLLIRRHLPLIPGLPAILTQAPRPHHPTPSASSILHPLPPPQPPPLPHPELPNPPILPQLLLSQQDMLRFQGLQPPLLLPQASPLHLPSQQPQILTSPPPLTLPLHGQNCIPTQQDNSIKFQFSAFLPLPLPVPIPIPIPIPFPILKKDYIKLGFSLRPDTDSDERESPKLDDTKLSESREKEPKSKSSHASKQSSSEDRSNCPSQSNPVSCTSQLKKQSPPSKSSCEPKEIVQPADSRGSERKGRSILKYTSDVYEIDGAFLPKHAWSTNSNTPADSECNSRIDKAHSHVSKPLESTVKSLSEGNNTKRKRPASDKNNQLKTKKKPLLH